MIIIIMDGNETIDRIIVTTIGDNYHCYYNYITSTTTINVTGQHVKMKHNIT